jgi:hypothetical protein
LQREGRPIVWSQVPTGRPLLRMSQMSVPTFRGRALCQILAVNWVVVELRRLRVLRKVVMLDVWED